MYSFPIVVSVHEKIWLTKKKSRRANAGLSNKAASKRRHEHSVMSAGFLVSRPFFILFFIFLEAAVVSYVVNCELNRKRRFRELADLGRLSAIIDHIIR